jgi:hypothetical protein
LGPGLLESAYEACLVYELRLRRLKVEAQKPLPIFYKDDAMCEFSVGFSSRFAAAGKADRNFAHANLKYS